MTHLAVIISAAAVVAVALFFLARKGFKIMSAELVAKLSADVTAAASEITSLKADKAALTAQVADLTNQLAAATAAQGTPDAALEPLVTQLESVLDPAAPVAPPTPVEPPPAS